MFKLILIIFKNKILLKTQILKKKEKKEIMFEVIVYLYTMKRFIKLSLYFNILFQYIYLYI